MEQKKVIFLADDDPTIRELIPQYLQRDGYEVITFSRGDQLMDALKGQSKPDMLILDIMMPGMDGYEVCKNVRKDSHLPIIFISARDDEVDKILGLELGSDDYLAKPFSPRELVARVKTVLRRVHTPRPEKDAPLHSLSLGDIIIFSEQRKVCRGQQEIPLTTKEYELFYFLVCNKGRVYNRQQLVDQVWGYDYFGDTRAVDDLIKRLRKKLKDAGSTLEVVTVWGYGYRIEA